MHQTKIRLLDDNHQNSHTMIGMTKDFFDTTAKRIRVLRGTLGYKQKDLERELNKLGAGVKGGYISNIERKGAGISQATLPLLAKALKTTVDYLTLATDDPKPLTGIEEPMYWSSQADEAARIVERILSPYWRDQCVQALRRIENRYEAAQKISQRINRLLEVAETRCGTEFRAEIARELNIITSFADSEVVVALKTSDKLLSDTES